MSWPTREQVVEWARDAGAGFACETLLADGRDADDLLSRLAALAYAAGQSSEREACAELCMTFDGTHESDRGHGPEMCADAIRARSNNKLKEAA